MEALTENKIKREVSTGMDRVLYGDGSSPIAALGISIEVGTPPQTVLIEPDTGSWQFWVPDLKPGSTRDSSKSIYFDRKHSYSMKDLRQTETIAYLGSEAYTNLFLDEISICGKSLGRSRIGVADLSKSKLSRHVGTLGLLTPPPGNWTDDFILTRLLSQKLVKSRAFSAGVRKKGRGTLTFGGYDTAKFSGPLEKLPMLKHDNNIYMVEMESLSFVNGNRSTSLLNREIAGGEQLSIALDSGAPGLRFRTEVFKEVTKQIGATLNNGLPTVPCDLVNSKARLDFKMTDSTTISVLLADFVVTRLDNNQQCRLAIISNGHTTDLWTGVQFLRRSYVVFDPDNKNLFVAKGADCGSNLVAIDSNIPTDAIGKCSEEVLEIDPPVDQAPGARPASI
ncbi:hypothetical protein QQS21_005833 [Conoideocrella luteorostrata]|uniref:Peptidase A1 domain-containing protein n=1 Tax=Conoideocrella luteorostrata TaxID=1105319 RepID=A0AAJ0FU31_9HYPO|nr:hypothetical protein QQS21_005833 [Conoideocrella luteorostrata]